MIPRLKDVFRFTESIDPRNCYADERGAWKVSTLVNRCRKLGLKPKLVAISNLEQQDAHHEQDRVSRANIDYPIILMPSSGGKYFIIDGYHRTKKIVQSGGKQVNAYILPRDKFPPPDAQSEEELYPEELSST